MPGPASPLQWIAFALAIGALAGACHTDAPSPDGRCRTARECERRIADADSAATTRLLLRDYAEVTDEPRWLAFDRWLELGDERLVVVATPTASVPRTINLDARLPTEPTHVPLPAFVSSLFPAQRHVVLVQDDTTVHHLFPRDRLAPFTAGLRGALVAELPALSADLELTRLTERALERAGQFDYLGADAAAREAQGLFSGASEEVAARTRFALRRLHRAGVTTIAIEPPAAAPPTRASLYAWWMIAADTAGSLREHLPSARPRLETALGAARMAELERRLAPKADCGTPTESSVVRSPADLAFLEAGATSLTPASEEALVVVAARENAFWALVAPLLAYSPDPETRDRDLLRHLESLIRLFEHRPEAFSLDAALRATAVRDPSSAVVQTLGDLVSRSVAKQMSLARDPGATLRAAAIAFGTVQVLPPSLRQAELSALRHRLAAKLGQPWAAPTQSWSAAGLHLASGILNRLLGQDDGLERALRRIAQGFVDAPVTGYERWVPVANAVANARPTSAGAPPAPVIASILAALSEEGPTSEDEQAFSRALQRLIEVVLGRASGEGEKACEAPFESLVAAAEAVLAAPPMTEPSTTWAARASLLGLVLTDLARWQSGQPLAGPPIDDERLRAALRQAPPPVGAVGRAYLALRQLGESSGGWPRITSALASLAPLLGEAPWLATLLDALPKDDATHFGAGVERAAATLYQRGETALADVLLLLSYSVHGILRRPMSPGHAALATEERRPFAGLFRFAITPLESIGSDALQRPCDPRSPALVVAVRQALRQREPKEALRILEHALAAPSSQRSVVPREVFTFRPDVGPLTLTVQHSLSFGSDLLANTGTFTLGFGVGSQQPDAVVSVERLGPSDEADVEAAQFAVAAHLLAAHLSFRQGLRAAGIRHTRVALEGLAFGFAFGPIRVWPEKDDDWSESMPALLAVVGQQVVDAGEPLVGGDAWALLEEPSEVELEPVRRRALRGIESGLLARVEASLRALRRCPSAESTARFSGEVACADYPTALALRTADALDTLPRLRSGSTCPLYGSYDRVFRSAAEGNFDGPAHEALVTALEAKRHHATAALMLTRHRTPRHCTGAVMATARRLADEVELGPHLRADLHSVRLTCDPAREEVADDIRGLDDLTAAMANPTRAFELLVFAARLAGERGQWSAAETLTRTPGYLKRERYGRFGFALLLHDAARVAAKRDLTSSARAYRRLCLETALDRDPLCDSLALLRSDSTAGDRGALARQLLRQAIARIRAR